MTIQQSDIEIVEELIPYDDTDDGKDHLTHIVSPPENRHISNDLSLEAKDLIDLARVTGEEMIALCGFRFVPKRNPEKYDACQDCIRIAGEIMRRLGE